MTEKWTHFYKQNYQDRLNRIAAALKLTNEQLTTLQTTNQVIFDHLVENYLTDYPLPEGVVTNINVNGQNYLVPMVTEEPSVIAAANNGAKLLASGGGVQGAIPERLLGGQIIIEDAEFPALKRFVDEHNTELLRTADQSHSQILAHGGGARAIITRELTSTMCSVDLLVDPSEAMGANLINTMLEAVAAKLATFGYEILMAILSNAAEHSVVTVSGKVPVGELATSKMSGEWVAQRISAASQVAQVDSQRAVTHNKGIMNGIDAVVAATGNDWRAVESAAHAFAAHEGHYRGLSHWHVQDDVLTGTMTLPMPVGLVGGAASVLPLAKFNRALMSVTHVQELMLVIASVGLAQNLAALKALVTDGIQKGHMSLQLKSLAMANGTRENELADVVQRLSQLKTPSATDVKKILKVIRKQVK